MDNRKQNLVIIDTHYDFLRKTEEEIFRRFADRMTVQLITDPGYVDAYFSEKQTIDLLVIDRDSYGDFLQEHKIGQVILITPEIEVGRPYPSNTSVLLNVIPVEEMIQKFEQILQKQSDAEEDSQEEVRHNTRVIGVYSPVGGCGKSLVCLALARKLRKLDQKVLMIGCDATQSLSVYYNSNVHAGMELAEKLHNPDEDTYWTILQNIGQDKVSYLLPFEKSLATIGIHTEDILKMVDILVQKQDFDVIILDIGSVLTPELSEYLSHIHAMVLVTETNEIANKKMQMLLKDPDLLPKCTCIIVANDYRSDGMRMARDSVFGTISPYQTWQEALEDPVFYRIALKVTE